MRLYAKTSAKAAAVGVAERVGSPSVGLTRENVLKGLAVTMAQRPRCLGFDESQELDLTGLETERAIWEDDSADTAMVIAGADVFEKLAAYPALMDRVLVPRYFVHPQDQDLREHVRGSFPQLRDASDLLIEQMDAGHAHGNLRRWAKAMFFAQHLTDRNSPMDFEGAVACIKAASGLPEKHIRKQMAAVRP